MNSKNGRFITQDDLLMKYISGRLSKKEKLAFEKELETKSELKVELQLKKNLLQVLQHPQRAKTAEHLLQLKAASLAAGGNPGIDTAIIRRFWQTQKRWIIGITAVLLFLGTLVVNNRLLIAGCDALFTRYLRPYESIFPDQSDNLALQEAIAFYEAEDYKQAEAGFKAAAEEDAIFLFYYAITRLFNYPDQTQTNLDYFNETQKAFEGNKRYKPFLPWIDYYKVLIFFKQKKFQKGKSSINDLYADNSLDASLQSIIQPFRFQLMLLFF